MNNLFGIRIDQKSKEQVLQIIKSSVKSRKKLYVVTLNTELLIASKSDNKINNLVNQANLIIPESSGLYLADHYLGSNLSLKFAKLLFSGWLTLLGKRRTLPIRFSGVDLAYAVADLASKFNFKLLLLGGQEGTANRASIELKKLFPNLNVVGLSGGKVGEDNRQILAAVKQVQSDIMLVGFGQPKQEKWIFENLPLIPAVVAIGVGGTLDYMAGSVVRAPKFLQKIGLEWLFRLILQPWRVKRQLALLKFISLLLKT